MAIQVGSRTPAAEHGADSSTRPAQASAARRLTGITAIQVGAQSSAPAPNFVARRAGLTIGASVGEAGCLTGLPARLRSDLVAFSSELLAGARGGLASLDAASPLGARWAEYVSKAAAQGNLDVGALVQAVLREAYNEATQDLAFYAEKVKFFNAVKKALRDELTAARTELAKHTQKAADEAIPAYPGKGIATDFTGGTGAPEATTAAYSGAVIDTKAELEAYIKEMEEKLQTVGDDAQLANLELDDMLQKQQQTLQTMSNISKMLHDTGMAVVRKIGG